jgi:hypothetical protein
MNGARLLLLNFLSDDADAFSFPASNSKRLETMGRVKSAWRETSDIEA